MGLNAEPGWRQAWKARLNSLFSKSYPPIIASTYPLLGSTLIKAPCSLGSCSSEYSPFLSPARTSTTSPGLMTPRHVVILLSSDLSSALGLRAHHEDSNGMMPVASPACTLADLPSFSTLVTSAANTSSLLPSPS